MYHNQVIQAVTCLLAIVGGHQQPLSSGHVFTIPKRSPFQTCHETSLTPITEDSSALVYESCGIGHPGTPISN